MLSDRLCAVFSHARCSPQATTGCMAGATYLVPSTYKQYALIIVWRRTHQSGRKPASLPLCGRRGASPTRAPQPWRSPRTRSSKTGSRPTHLQSRRSEVARTAHSRVPPPAMSPVLEAGCGTCRSSCREAKRRTRNCTRSARGARNGTKTRVG